jgi:hypothetical protein
VCDGKRGEIKWASCSAAPQGPGHPIWSTIEPKKNKHASMLMYYKFQHTERMREVIRSSERVKTWIA